MTDNAYARWPYKLFVQFLYSPSLPGLVTYNEVAFVEIPALCRHLSMKKRRFLEHIDELERIGLISDLVTNKSALRFKLRTPPNYGLLEK